MAERRQSRKRVGRLQRYVEIGKCGVETLEVVSTVAADAAGGEPESPRRRLTMSLAVDGGAGVGSWSTGAGSAADSGRQVRIRQALGAAAAAGAGAASLDAPLWSNSRTRAITCCGSKGLIRHTGSSTGTDSCVVNGVERTRQQQHRNPRQRWRVADMPRHRIAIAAGHVDIRQDNVGRGRVEPRHGLVTVANGDHRHVFVSEGQFDDPLDRDAVIGEQERMRHARLRVSGKKSTVNCRFWQHDVESARELPRTRRRAKSVGRARRP